MRDAVNIRSSPAYARAVGVTASDVPDEPAGSRYALPSIGAVEHICDLLVAALRLGALHSAEEQAVPAFTAASSRSVSSILAIATAADESMDSAAAVPVERGMALTQSIRRILRTKLTDSRAVAGSMRLLKELVLDYRLARHFAMSGGIECMMTMQASNWNECLVGYSVAVLKRVCLEPSEASR